MPDISLNIKGKNLSSEAIQQFRTEIEKTTKALNEQSKTNLQVENTGEKLNKNYAGLTVAVGALGASLGLLTKSIVNAATNQERMFKSLTAVEGGAKNAEKAMTRLREVAKMPGLNLQQAVQGYTNLRAIDMNAQLAERALRAFGNALVTVGKGAPELNLVILALTQMSAKGKVLGQDLRQLQEQLPQIRKVMKEAFGTADVEAVQKKLEETGQTADDFIKTIVSGFEKLPQVTGGIGNAIENFNDKLTETKVALGEALLPYLTKALDGFSKLLDIFNSMPRSMKDIIGTSIAGGTGLIGIGFAIGGIAKIVPSVISGIKALQIAFVSANTASGIFASSLSGVAIQLGTVASAAGSVIWAINQIRASMEAPIDIAKLQKEANLAKIKELQKAKEIVEKQMTRAEYKPGDYVSGITELKLRKIFPNIAPLTTVEELLEKINAEIDKLQGKKTPSIFSDVKEIKTVFSFDELTQKFSDLTSIIGEKWGIDKQAQLDWWNEWLAKPQALTDDAKIGVKNTVKQLQDEIEKEARSQLNKNKKFSISDFIVPREKPQVFPSKILRPGPFENQIFPYADLVDTSYMFPEEILKEYIRILPIVTEATKYLVSAQSEQVAQEQEMIDHIQEHIRLEDERQHLLKGNADMINGISNEEYENALKFRLELEKKALDTNQEALDRAFENIQNYKDEQIKVWEDLAYSISDVFAQIPKDIIQNFNDLEQVLKNFAMNMLNMLANMASQALGNKIFNSLMGIFINGMNLGTGNTGGFGALGSIGMALATNNPMELIGVGASAIEGIFFDDPANDLMAYKSGEKSAIAMTRKSSMDFINNFESGFAKGSHQTSGLGDKLDKLISLMENTKYEFYLDSDPIVSTVRKKTNKKIDRGEWAR